jgi:hypothetical protein
MDQTPSPTGAIIAVTYFQSGGGAVGWCSERVALLSRGIPVKPAEIDKETDFVFSASCGSRIKLTWISDSELKIAYTIDSAWVSVHQRNSDGKTHVHVAYVPSHERAIEMMPCMN